MEPSQYPLPSIVRYMGIYTSKNRKSSEPIKNWDALEVVNMMTTETRGQAA